MHYLLLLLLLVALGCENSDANSPDYADPRGQQLVSVYQNGVLPSHGDFVAATEALLNTTEVFSEAPSSAGLMAVQASWRVATLQWKRCEVYDFGPVGDFFLATRIHRWPADTVSLEEKLLTGEPIDEAFIAAKGSSVVGLAALEYLLFGDGALTALSTNPSRRAYLRATTRYLLTTARELQRRWKEAGPDFTSNSTLSTDGGQNIFTNGLIAYLDKSIRFRLRAPLGELNGTAINPQAVETPYADLSSDCLRAGFGEWKRAYYGGAERITDYGFDDYLLVLGNKSVGPAINEAIERVDSQLQDLGDVDLNHLLLTNPVAVRALVDDLRALLVLIRVDLSSAIGVVLTVNDADGD